MSLKRKHKSDVGAHVLIHSYVTWGQCMHSITVFGLYPLKKQFSLLPEGVTLCRLIHWSCDGIVTGFVGNFCNRMCGEAFDYPTIELKWFLRSEYQTWTTFRNNLCKYLYTGIFHTLQVDTATEIFCRVNCEAYLKSLYGIYMNQDSAVRCVSEITSAEGSETAICLCCPDPGVCVYLSSSFAW